MQVLEEANDRDRQSFGTYHRTFDKNTQFNSINLKILQIKNEELTS